MFNVETFGQVAALGPAIAGNLDPSHFFWMGMDGHQVAAALGARIGHAHGKDTVFHAESLALNLAWWAGLVRALGGSEA